MPLKHVLLILFVVSFLTTDGNVVQRHSTNHLGGYEHVYLALSFTGNIILYLTQHQIDQQMKN